MEGVRISRAAEQALSVMSWVAYLSQGNASLTVQGRASVIQHGLYHVSHSSLVSNWLALPHSPQTREVGNLILPDCSTTSGHNSGTRLPQDPWDKDLQANREERAGLRHELNQLGLTVSNTEIPCLSTNWLCDHG